MDSNEPYILKTFQAYVDLIIPRTPELATKYGDVQYFGALDLKVEEYLIWSLNYYENSMAKSVAYLLNTAAEELLNRGGNKSEPDFSNDATFAALSYEDRFQVLILLKQKELGMEKLPNSIESNIFYITDLLSRLTIMGYYSEWFGDGSTRLESPNDRSLEFNPLSWEQTSYPGPALYYRAFRPGTKQQNKEM